LPYQVVTETVWHKAKHETVGQGLIGDRHGSQPAGLHRRPIEMTPQTEQRLRTQPPIRFLLTFDDGPSASSFWNPSETVLDSLARNSLQPDIKAVFFVQTRAHGPAAAI
jgi:peptidoglycan/xylan/chitin deacetylase (PgdA/CDA1 family)